MHLFQNFHAIRYLSGAMILMSSFSIAQDDVKKEIDLLLKKSEISYGDLDQWKSLEYAREANILAIQSGDSERIARSYCNMAMALTNQQMQKESIEYLDKAFQQEYTQNNTDYQAFLMFLKANNHSTMGLYAMSYKENYEALNLLKKTKSTLKTLELKAKILGEIGTSYYVETGNLDSTFKYHNLKYAVLEKLPEPLVFQDVSKVYDTKGYLFLETNLPDSALHYFEKGYYLKLKHNDPVLYMQYCAFADYYFANGDEDKALDYYLKTVENIEQYKIQDVDYVSAYKTLSEIYGKLGQKEKESFYIKKYAAINNKYLKANEKNANAALKIILNDKEEYLQKSKSELYWIIAGILGIGIIISILFYFFHQKMRKTKRKAISNSAALLQEKEQIITQKEQETQQLKLKVNESFDEIINLAKENDPQFFTRFQEVYPDFTTKILQIEPKLQTSELTFSAYIFLNFTTKDIANYTFTSPKTVQNRKNHLRKKLQISSDKDIYIWMKEMMD